MKINLQKVAINSFLAAALFFNLGSVQVFAHCGHCQGDFKGGEPCHSKMKKEMDKMFAEIGVNCEQKKQIDCIMQNSKAQSRPIRKCMREKKKALMQYMMTPQATQEQALCMENEISEMHKQIHAIRINTFFEMKKVLTPCQQQKMADYHQKHMAEFEKKHEQYHKAHGCPMD